MSRRARLVLCTDAGAVLGALPPVEVDSPWWPDVEPVVAAVREQHGVDVLVLRLLDARGTDTSLGGEVTYLAELVGDPPAALEPTSQVLDDDPRRAPYARPGGLRAIIGWADGVIERTGPPEQVKTWNLSSVLRLPTATGPVWCKSVPPFFAHEGQVLRLVGDDDPELVPPVLGVDPATGTVLLADVPGDDLWDASEDQLLGMVERLVRLQERWADRTDELLAAGLSDWRGPSLAPQLAELAARADVRAHLTDGEQRAVGALVATLPATFDALDGCGLPDTLVHGDFHPGNWRSDGRSLVLIDWGDSGVGHPLLDATAFLPRIADEPTRARVREAWVAAWRRARPGSDPQRALDLVLPIAALRQALIYRTFLDGIERTEQRYHERDVPDWIRRAIR